MRRFYYKFPRLNTFQLDKLVDIFNNIGAALFGGLVIQSLLISPSLPTIIIGLSAASAFWFVGIFVLGNIKEKS
jgi:hypothetical protein